jgi:transposase
MSAPLGRHRLSSGTATLRGEEPGDYLLRAALAAIENPGTVTLSNSLD